MNIVIAGCGKVGYLLANTLSIAHNVFIIDKNKKALSKVQESLDILTIFGDIKNPQTYQNIDIDVIDLFIGVTNSDEANIISALIIDGILDVKEKIVRVQSSYYKDTNIKERLNINKFIMPSLIASKSIKALVEYPKINNIKSFKDSEFKLISIYATKDFTKEELSELLEPTKEVILGIERDKNFFITQNTQIQKGDLVYILALKSSITRVSSIFNKELPNEIKRCVIFGCNELSIEIAKVLIEHKKIVKIIDKDINSCQIAQEELNGEAEVINSIYNNDEDIFIDEGIDSAEFFISAFKSDEFNIIKCLEAKEFGVKKVVATNNESSYYNLMHSLNIITLRGEKVSAYHKILEEINSSNIIVEKYFCGGKGVIFFRKLSSSLVGKKINCSKFKDALFFLLDKNSLEPLNNQEISSQSAIIAVCAKDLDQDIRKFLYGL